MKLKNGSSLVVHVYIILTLFLCSFVGSNGSTGFFDMSVPFIEGKVVVIHTLFSAALLFLFLVISAYNKQRIRIDIISGCFLLKCILDILPVLSSNTNLDNYFGFYASTVVSFVSYFMTSNEMNSFRSAWFLKKALALFALVISTQVIYTAIISGISYYDIFYKSYMVIPYGGSNIISAILVPILCMIYFEQKIYKNYIVLLFILTIAVIATKSRGGILLLLLFIVYLFLSEVRNKHNYTCRGIFIGIMILMLLIAIIPTLDFQKLIVGYSVQRTGSSFSLNSISSGRIEGWSNMFSGLDKSIFLTGIGMQSKVGNLSGAHNIIIDLLIKSGLIGTINYLVLFITLFKKGHFMFRKYKSSLYVMIVIIYINSMFEVNYFTYMPDAILWMVAGMMMSEYYASKASLLSLSKKVSKISHNQESI